MRCDVFKRTTDDWYPPYVLEDGRALVRVSFIKLTHSEYLFRVCAWGMDDFGMEKDFEKEKEAWVCFRDQELTV